MKKGLVFFAALRTLPRPQRCHRSGHCPGSATRKSTTAKRISTCRRSPLRFMLPKRQKSSPLLPQVISTLKGGDSRLLFEYLSFSQAIFSREDAHPGLLRDCCAVSEETHLGYETRSERSTLDFCPLLLTDDLLSFLRLVNLCSWIRNSLWVFAFYYLICLAEGRTGGRQGWWDAEGGREGVLVLRKKGRDSIAEPILRANTGKSIQ